LDRSIYSEDKELSLSWHWIIMGHGIPQYTWAIHKERMKQ
jgi:hypothetical protein